MATKLQRSFYRSVYIGLCIILFLFLYSCKEKAQNDKYGKITTQQEIKDTIFKESPRLNELAYFNPVNFFYNIKIDTITFLKNVAHKYNLEYFTEYLAIDKTITERETKVIRSDSLKIFGSNEFIYIFYVQHPDAGTVSLPNHILFAFDKKGKLLLNQGNCGLFKIMNVDKKQNPFIVTTEETGKGNGTHRLYKYVSDTLVNCLNTGNWDINTVDGHQDENIFEPNEMRVKILDVNKDGLNDLQFSTTLIVECFEGSSKIKRRLKYNFIFDSVYKTFEPAGDYTFEQYYKLCK